MYTAYITKIKNLRKHSNADRLQCGDCFGNQVIVSLNTAEDDLGIYFPVDGQLGIEFATENNLLRKKNEKGEEIGGYLDPDKRNIVALKLRGEISDGLFMPLTSLSKFTDISKLEEGNTVTELDGILICEKYIPRRNHNRSRTHSSHPKKKVSNFSKYNTPKFPIFYEHTDTSQLSYNINRFREGDLCTITLKMHGTSARISHTLETKAAENKLIYRIKDIFKRKHKQACDWTYVSGSRRVILSNYDGGFY